jgi:transposase
MSGASTVPVEYETKVVGVAGLAKGILDRLGVAAAIDQVLTAQPAIGATYGTLAEVLIINRMTFDPQPLYHLSTWAERHGIDRLLGLEAAWLDDDRLGALLEALARQQVTIWTAILQQAVAHYPVTLDWLRADTTSIYFEGAYEDEHGQPKGGEAAGIPRLVTGYNKDGKPNKVQVVLSLVTGGPSGRVPVWYRSWNGNQTDEPVYVADLTALRATLLAPANAVLLGDRKLCTAATLLTFSRQRQQFLAPHPWTDTAKAVWQTTWAAVAAERLTWTAVDYTSRNTRRTPADARPVQRVCEVSHDLLDPETGELYPLRWLFTWSSTKAERDAARRARVLAAGERELARLAGLLGKYQYKRRASIEARIAHLLRRTQAQPYLACRLEGTDADQAWHLTWTARQAALDQAACFDGVVLLCSNVPPDRCSAAELVLRHKGQIGVEQTIDFLKSPIQIRPMWLHSPRRIAGLTLLIMLAVLLAALVEHQVRAWIARTGELLRGVLPERRDTPYPTATALLRAFRDYALVVIHFANGATEVHYPKLRPLQQQIWTIMGLPPPASLNPGGRGSGK